METPFSVILCTHNPRPEYLRRTLDSLRSQTLSPERWELLLVDNASKQRLADLWDLSWHARARHVREETPGLTAARLRGIEEATGELLVFVDDDNVLAADYLEHSATIYRADARLGVFGSGSLEPEFEVPPPPELTGRLSMLALRTVASSLWTNNPKDYSCIPWGAGLVVTRHVANVYREFLEKLNIDGLVDRRGQRLFSGGDDLFSWTAASAGLGFGVFPQLRITHLISAGRLNRPYFLRLLHDHAYSNGVLSYLLADARLSRIDGFRVGRLLLHGARNGYFSMQCQLAAARGEDAASRFVARNRLRPIHCAERSADGPVPDLTEQTVRG
jgi:glycosyltransferase involved in cell wall biosynthesis